MDFYKNIKNHLEIKEILQKYEIDEKEKDVEFFDKLITGISEDYPDVLNLTVVLERILVFIVRRDLSL
tara:strand:+ start:1301 stop:1504 length:204 start_codon:yes stop_codon:yes gene_type:complete